MPLSENGERLRTKRRRTREVLQKVAHSHAQEPTAPTERLVMPKFKMQLGSVRDHCRKQDAEGRFCAVKRKDLNNPDGYCERHEWLALHPDYREDD